MSVDYSTNTVVQLKEIFKSRGIPTTGLTRKAQLIEKLVEVDAEEAQAAPPEEEEQPESVDVEGDTGEEVVEVAPSQDEAVLPETEDLITKEASSAPVAEEAAESTPAAVDMVDAPAEDVEQPEAPADEPVETMTGISVEVDKDVSAPAQTAEAIKTNGDLPTPDATGMSEAAITEPATEDSKTVPTAQGSEESAPEAMQIDEAQSGESESKVAPLEPPREKSPATASPSAARDSTPDESRKRKRRSPTPPLQSEDIAIKRSKPDEHAPQVRLEEDTSAHSAQAMDVTANNEVANDIETAIRTNANDKAKRQRVGGLQRDPTIELDKAYATLEFSSDQEVQPSRHPATSALYISELVRPVREQYFKQALLNHAEPPTSYDDEDGADSKHQEHAEILTFYMDNIRTHCFVVFDSVAAATRVRSTLHNQIFPRDGDRKPLWIDFVPSEKVERWIAQEKEATGGSRTSTRRWEVLFDESNDGQVSVELIEGSGIPQYHLKTQQATSGPVQSTVQVPSEPVVTSAAPQDLAFTHLEEAFRSTKSTKPLLYYQPVAAEIAEARLAELDRQMSRGYTSGQIDTPPHARLFKYVFEDDDRIYNDGQDRGTAPLGPRGPRGRGRGRGWGGRY